MSTVYLIATEDRTAAKIGVANDLPARLACLQTGNHSTLEVIATAPGGTTEERHLHRELADIRRVGEWFSRPGDCLDEFWRLPGARLEIKPRRGVRPSLANLARASLTDSSCVGVLASAMNVGQDDACSCHQFYSDLKPWLSTIVGWRSISSDRWMHSSDAYDAVYFATWACLPPCREAICSGARL